MPYWSLQDEIAEAEMLQLNLGRCDGPCQREEDVPRVLYMPHRMDSDKKYWMCAYCVVEDFEYWEEMWKDYWSERL